MHNVIILVHNTANQMQHRYWYNIIIGVHAIVLVIIRSSMTTTTAPLETDTEL